VAMSASAMPGATLRSEAVPAAPKPDVEEVMAAPLCTPSVPVDVTVTVPALPEPAVLELISALLLIDASLAPLLTDT